MPVEVAEVARVDPPRTLVRFVCQRCARGFGLCKYRVDLLSARDEVPDAELSGLRCGDRHARILREIGAPVESEDQPALELEHRRGAAGSLLVSLELRADHA